MFSYNNPEVGEKRLKGTEGFFLKMKSYPIKGGHDLNMLNADGVVYASGCKVTLFQSSTSTL